MSGNLPPGVTEGMIPGNRPIDRLYEEMEERVRGMTVGELYDKLPAKSKHEAALDSLIEWATEQLADDCIDAQQDGPHGGDGPDENFKADLL